VWQVAPTQQSGSTSKQTSQSPAASQVLPTRSSSSSSSSRQRSPVSWNQCVSLRAACTVAAQWQKPSSHLLDLQRCTTAE
jgi:hypothetical protein